MNLFDIIKTQQKRSKHDHALTLSTPFAGHLSDRSVLPEYPRPQMVRKDYLNLNGYWDFAFLKNGFMTKKACQIPAHFSDRILVPFSPESQLSGIHKQVGPTDAIWYHKTFSIEQLPKQNPPDKKRLLLNFGAVDQICIVYINHKEAFRHVGGYLPFSLDITRFLIHGTNHIHVLVRDFTDTSYHARGKQKLHSGGMFYQCQSGIWQTVFLEWVPDIYIKNLELIADYDTQLVKITPNLSAIEYTDASKNDNTNPSAAFKLTMDVQISFCGHVIFESHALPTGSSVYLAQFYPWSPEHPNLYQITIKIGEDRVESYFAFRSVKIAKTNEKGKKNKNVILLNNKPYFMKGVLDQGYWPDGLYTPASYDAFAFDIASAKALGFNMIRKHVKIEPAYFYYLCDKLGMLVWQDMVNGGNASYNLPVLFSLPINLLPSLKPLSDHHYHLTACSSKKGRKEWLKDCLDTVSYLKTFPCIVAWVPFNEGWGQFNALQIVRKIRTLDDTRLIDHASGWFDQGGGDFKSEHNYFKKLTIKKDPHRAYVLSEYGGLVLRINDHSFRQHTFGYQTYHDKQQFQQAYQKLDQYINELSKKGLCACVYTQLSDVEEEMNGLFTYDRRVCKVDDSFKMPI